MAESKTIRNVVVYLGSGKNPSPESRRAAVDFADYLAAHDMTLVFGGSNKGMMKILADAMLHLHLCLAVVYASWVDDILLGTRRLRQDNSGLQPSSGAEKQGP